ncbi:hypothetical protein [[Flexibacter] sp. ATCC 35208]|uniref:hypothetical protein n=1 Tax=[Flexibacter] sp. ATCC 35208 TaxID=1936242 RepID=UPI00117EF540|nr:hypothetical protein [[Flexibacter] sp. ATCC 35208]
MKIIPDNFIDFLYWIKERTETYWSQDPKTTDKDFVCSNWIYGAKWIGLTDTEIKQVEERYGIRFTPEHKAFLKILHTIDRKEKVYPDPDIEEGVFEEKPFFFNWLHDDGEISRAFKWPFEQILADIMRKPPRRAYWTSKWGPLPQKESDKEAFFIQWFKNAPKLMPVRGHCFQVCDLSYIDRPILSIWGSDIIIYGMNFREYLLASLSNDLDVYRYTYDEEDETFYPEFKPEFDEYFNVDTRSRKRIENIPYWRDIVEL